MEESWIEADSKFIKHQFQQCLDQLKAIQLGEFNEDVRGTLALLIDNNKLVCRASEKMVSGDGTAGMRLEFEELRKSLSDKHVSSLQGTLAVAIVTYNSAIMQASSDIKATLNILEGSLLDARNLLLGMMSAAEKDRDEGDEPKAKKQKINAQPRMQHINPDINGIVDDILKNWQVLAHKQRNSKGFCGAKCALLDVTTRSLQLFSLLSLEHSPQQSLHFLQAMVGSIHNSSDENLCGLHMKSAPVSFYLLAVALALQGNRDKSEMWLEKCLKLRPQFFPAAFFKGQLEFEKGNFESAKMLFRLCSTNENYRPVDSLNMQGACLLKTGNTKYSLEKLQQAIAMEDSKLAPIFNVASVYRAAGKPESELNMLGFVSKGLKCQQQEELQPSARINFDETTIIQNNTVLSVTAKTISPLGIAYLQANAAARSNNFTVASKKYQDVLQKILPPKGNQEIVFVSSTKIICEYIYVVLELKDYQTARDYCEKLLKVSPNNPQALIYLPSIIFVVALTNIRYKADIFKSTGKLSEALETLEKAIHNLKPQATKNTTELQSSPQDNTNMLACILINQHKDEEALKSLRLALRIDPKHAQSCYHYALLLLKLGKQMDACLFWMDHRNIPTDLNAAQYEKLLEDKKSDGKFLALDKLLLVKYWIPDIGKPKTPGFWLQ